MAEIPSYLSWNPKSGTGNKTVTINSAQPYKGRTDRETVIPGKIAGKANSIEVTVIETAEDEFITPEADSLNVTKAGETIHITGKSNSKLLTFEWSENFGLTNVTSYKVNSTISAVSGTAIPDDPGATSEYIYDVTVVVPPNNTVLSRVAKLLIKNEEGIVNKTITITQAVGDSYLYINSQGTTSATVTIPKGGGAQTINIISNDSWTFEPAD